MARSFARLACGIWSDPDFRDLTPDEQRVYMMAFSQPNIALTGVVPYTARRWARLAAGTTAADIEKAVAGLTAARFLVVDEDTEEVLVRSFTRHDGVLRSPKTIVAMSRDYEAIDSPDLRRAFLAELPSGFLGGLTDSVRKSLSERFVADLIDHQEAPPDTPSDHVPDTPSDRASHGLFAEPGISHGIGYPSRGGARGQPEPEPEPAPPPQPLPPPSSASTTAPSARAERPEEEEDRIDAACRILAQRDLERRDDPRPVKHPQKWLADVAANRRDRHDDEARRHLDERPHVTATQLADLLDPPAPAAGSTVPNAEETAARQDAEDAAYQAELAEAERCRCRLATLGADVQAELLAAASEATGALRPGAARDRVIEAHVLRLVGERCPPDGGSDAGGTSR